MSNAISLTPGFSPVMAGQAVRNSFNGFSHADKPLKRLARRDALATRLKPGVNGSRCALLNFASLDSVSRPFCIAPSFNQHADEPSALRFAEVTLFFRQAGHPFENLRC